MPGKPLFAYEKDETEAYLQQRMLEDMAKREAETKGYGRNTAEAVASGVIAPIESMAKRAAGAMGVDVGPLDADTTNRINNARQSAMSEEDKKFAERTGVPEWVTRNARGVATNALPATLAMGSGLGAAPLIGYYASSAYDQALTEGKDAGLKGEELQRYAMIKGGVEGGVTAGFSMVGLGGLESMVKGQVAKEGAKALAGDAVKQSVRQALTKVAKQAGVQVTAETIEEATIEFLNANTEAAYVNPDATKWENMGPRLWDTFVQTVGTMGLMGGINKAASAIDGRNAKQEPKPGEPASGQQRSNPIPPASSLPSRDEFVSGIYAELDANQELADAAKSGDWETFWDTYQNVAGGTRDDATNRVASGRSALPEDLVDAINQFAPDEKRARDLFGRISGKAPETETQAEPVASGLPELDPYSGPETISLDGRSVKPLGLSKDGKMVVVRDDDGNVFGIPNEQQDLGSRSNEELEAIWREANPDRRFAPSRSEMLAELQGAEPVSNPDELPAAEPAAADELDRDTPSPEDVLTDEDLETSDLDETQSPQPRKEVIANVQEEGNQEGDEGLLKQSSDASKPAGSQQPAGDPLKPKEVKGEIADDANELEIIKDGRKRVATVTASSEEGGWRVKHVKITDPETGKYEYVPFPNDAATGYESYEQARADVFEALKKRYSDSPRIEPIRNPGSLLESSILAGDPLKPEVATVATNEAGVSPEPVDETQTESTPVGETQTNSEPVDENGFRKFPSTSGTLGVPRAEMPQVKSEHRGALSNFLRSRGIEFDKTEVLPTDLKATQAEYSPEKVEKARKFDGEERAILVSSDGYIVDGHHQWQRNIEDSPDTPMPVVRLGAPIADVLSAVKEFPSSDVSKESETKKNPLKPVTTEATPVVSDQAPVVSDPLKPETNESLATKAKTGDVEARNKLIELNQGIVAKVARSAAKNENDIQDLIQKANLWMLESGIDGFDPEKGKFSTYLQNQLAYRLRPKKRKGLQAEVPAEEASDAVAPAEEVGAGMEQADETAKYREMVGSLEDPRERQAIVDHVMGDRTMKDLAGEWGVSTKRASQILISAKAKLREMGGEKSDPLKPKVATVAKPTKKRKIPENSAQATTGREDTITETIPQTEETNERSGEETEPGQRTVGSDRPPLSELGQAGTESTLATADGKSRKVQYIAVEANEVIPSHDARRAFNRNVEGDENERPYHDPKQGAASRQTVVAISEMDPEKVPLLLSDTRSVVDGPPITTDTGVVLGGNARAMGMQLAYFNGGESAARLKQATVEAAAKFGIDRAAIEGMKEPVIVRVLDDPGERGQLSALLNESLAAAKTQATVAVSQGKRVSEETATKISSMLEPEGLDDTPSLRELLSKPKQSDRIVQMLQRDGAWSAREVELYIDPVTNSINADGKAAIENLLVGRLIADPSIVGDASPGVRQKLIGAIGPLVRGMADKMHGARLTQVIRDSVKAFDGYKADGRGVQAYFMEQQSLFEDVPGQNDYAVAGVVHAMDKLGPVKFKNAMDGIVRSLGIKTGGQSASLFGEMDESVGTLEEAVEIEINPPARKAIAKRDKSPKAKSVKSFMDVATEMNPKFADGDLVGIGDLRRKMNVPKAEFDKAILEASARGEIALQPYGNAGTKDQQYRDTELVQDGDTYFNVFSKRRAPKEPAKQPNPFGETRQGREYAKHKDANPGKRLAFRMGDFYELFGDDAKDAAKRLGLTLTTRDKNSDNPIPMAGFPYHQIQGYLNKMGGDMVAIEPESSATAKPNPLKQEPAKPVTLGESFGDPDGEFQANYLVQGNRRVGTINYGMFNKETGQIGDVVLDDSARGTGALQSIYPEIETRLREQGAKSIRLNTVDDAVGEKVWKPLGFELEGRIGSGTTKAWRKRLTPKEPAKPSPPKKPAVEQPVPELKRGDVVSWANEEAEVMIPEIGPVNPGAARIKYTTGPKKGQLQDVPADWLRPLAPEKTAAGKAKAAAAKAAEERAAIDAKVTAGLIAEVVPIVRELGNTGTNLKPKTKKGKSELLSIVSVRTRIRNDEMLQAAIDQVASEIQDSSPKKPAARKNRRYEAGVAQQPMNSTVRPTIDPTQGFANYYDGRADIAAADIVKTWERAFGVPIRSGRMGAVPRRVTAFYKVFPAVVRIRENHYANLAVDAHEVAHHIDEMLGVVDSVPAYVREELKTLDYDQDPNTGQRPFEGYAEFMRKYLTERDTAAKEGPKTHKWMTDTWMKQHPDMARKIEAARSQALRFADQSVIQRIDSLIRNSQPDYLEFEERFRRDLVNGFNEFVTDHFDRYHPATLFDQAIADAGGPSDIKLSDAMLVYSMSEGPNASKAIADGVHDLQTGENLGAPSLASLGNHLKHFNELDDAKRYAFARHTLFMNEKKPGYQTVMRLEDAEALVSDIERNDPDQAERFEAFANDLALYANSIREMQMRAGALPESDYVTITEYYQDEDGNNYYFPLKRVRDGEQGWYGGKGSGPMNSGKAVKGRSKHGSDRPIYDPIDQLQQETVRAYRVAADARIARLFVEKASQTPGMGFLAEKVPPDMKVQEGILEEIMDSLVKAEFMTEDEAKASIIGSKIRVGGLESISPKSLKWFAEYQGVDLDETSLDEVADMLVESAMEQPDAFQSFAMYRPVYQRNNEEQIAVYYDRQGKPQLWKLDAPIFQMMVGAGSAELDAFESLLTKGGKVFKDGAVGVSLPFALLNLPRDWGSYIGRGKNQNFVGRVLKPGQFFIQYLAYKAARGVGYDTTKDTAVSKALKAMGVDTDNAAFNLFDEMGGKIYSRMAFDFKGHSRNQRRLFGESANLSGGGRLVDMAMHPVDTLKNAYETLKDVIAISDAPPRLADMTGSLKKDGWTWDGESWIRLADQSKHEQLPEDVRIRAMMAAGEATVNFKRVGLKSKRREAYLPFYNATLQSVRRSAILYASAKDLGSGGDKGRQAQRYYAYLAMIAAAEVARMAMMGGDDEEDERDAYLLDQYWSWWSSETGETSIKFPKPRDEAIIGNLIRVLWRNAKGDSRDSVGETVYRDLIGRVPSPGGIVDAGLGLYANWDDFKQRPVEPDRFKDMAPENRHDNYTTEWSKAIGQITGRAFGMSPMKVDYALSATTGGAYRKAADTYDMAVSKDPDMMSLIPGSSAFWRGRHEARSFKDFYIEKEELPQLLNRAETDGDPKATELKKKLRAYTDYAGLMTAMIEKEPLSAIGRRQYAYQPYLVGVAREAMGRTPAAPSPSPYLVPKSELPEELHQVLIAHAEGHAKKAILGFDMPTDTVERRKGESNQEYDARVARRKEDIASYKMDVDIAMEFLEKHKGSVYVQEAIRNVTPKADPLKKPKYDAKSETWSEHMKDLDRWKAKAELARNAKKLVP